MTFIINSVRKTINWKILILIFPFFQNLGCLEYDEMIFMKVDGSGELKIHYQAEKDMKFENLYFPTDIYDVKNNIKENYVAGGLIESLHEIRQKDDLTHIYMDFTFDSLDLLNSTPRFQNERFETLHSEGQITLKRFIFLDEEKIDRTKLVFNSGFRSLFSNKVFSEIKFRFQWIVPGLIVDTNASILGDKNRAIWNISLEEILKQKSVEFYLVYQPVTAISKKGN